MHVSWPFDGVVHASLPDLRVGLFFLFCRSPFWLRLALLALLVRLRAPDTRSNNLIWSGLRLLAATRRLSGRTLICNR